jgi:hypothetical protein
MKCEECLPLLELYSDGELSAPEAGAVAAHLGACAPCSARLQSLRDEQALYLRYECDPSESPAFWDGVLANIRAEKARPPEAPAAWHRRRLAALLSSLSAPRFSPTLTAALLLVAVVLTAAVMRYFGPREEPPRQHAEAGKDGGGVSPPPRKTDELAARTQEPDREGRAIADGPEALKGRDVLKKAGVVAESKRARKAQTLEVSEASPDKLVRDAEQKYLAAIRILSRDLGRQRTRMDPDTLARFDRTLGVIDKSIAETRAAARRHPRDPVAVQYMLAAYAKKVEVLRDMAQE